MVKKPGKRPQRSRKTFWIILIILVGTFSFAWWIWPGLGSLSPKFHSLLLDKNGQILRILHGETFQVHPRDRIKILDISTNITFNIGVRLVTPGFDIVALTYEKLPIASLLPHDSYWNPQKFKILVKKDNQDMGYLDLVVEPFVEDWLAKAKKNPDPQERIALLKQAAQMAPQELLIQDRLIEEYKSQKQWTEAARILEKRMAEKPDQKVLSDLTEIYEAASDKRNLLSTLRRQMEIDPGNTMIRLKIARIMEEDKQFVEAAVEYEKALEKMNKEDGLPILKTLGYLYAETGRMEKAISFYQKALEGDKGDPNLYYNLSTLYEKMGDRSKANHFLNQALTLQSGDLEGRLTLAGKLYEEGKLTEAEYHLLEILKARPDSMKALLLMIQVLEKRGDKKRLKETYEKILSLEPGNEIILNNLGLMEQEMGNPAKSIAYFEKLAELRPKDAEVHALLFELYRKEKKEELALKEARTLIALNPKTMAPYAFLFEVANNRGAYQDVVEIFKKGLEFQAENVDLRQYLVLAYLRLGKEDLAMEQMQEMVKLRPKEITFLLQLARLQEKRDKVQEAILTNQKILEISPGHEEAQEAYLRLRIRALPVGK